MIKWDTDIIKFKCNIKNPCFLFLSEVYYPKWKAYINNNSGISPSANPTISANSLRNILSIIFYQYAVVTGVSTT